MNLARNADVNVVAVKGVEGGAVYGGELLVKPMLKGEQMTLLEAHYEPGVGAPLHVHTHESIIYVVRGRVRTIVGGEEHVLAPGDAARHPSGVSHTVEAVEESIVLEIKSPAPSIESFLTV
jgi:quercetin dioxygenase-like cupin family protein